MQKINRTVYHKEFPDVSAKMIGDRKIGVSNIEVILTRVVFSKMVDFQPGNALPMRYTWMCETENLFPTKEEAKAGMLFSNSMKFVRDDK